jgi:hypothetical protein
MSVDVTKIHHTSTCNVCRCNDNTSYVNFITSWRMMYFRYIYRHYKLTYDVFSLHLQTLQVDVWCIFVASTNIQYIIRQLVMSVDVTKIHHTSLVMSVDVTTMHHTSTCNVCRCSENTSYVNLYIYRHYKLTYDLFSLHLKTLQVDVWCIFVTSTDITSWRMMYFRYINRHYKLTYDVVTKIHHTSTCNVCRCNENTSYVNL